MSGEILHRTSHLSVSMGQDSQKSTHVHLPAAVEETANEKSRAYPSPCVSYPCSSARHDQVLALTASGTVGYATCRRYNAQRGELY